MNFLTRKATPMIPLLKFIAMTQAIFRLGRIERGRQPDLV